MKKLLAFGLAGVLLSSSAFAVIHIGGQEGEVNPRFNIDIPTDSFTRDQAIEVINTLAKTIKEGETKVVFADVLSEIKIPGEFQSLVQKIVDSRDESATVLCEGRKCKITSSGEAMTFKVDGVTLPVVGTPSVSLGKAINIFAQVSEDGQSLEVCRMEGINIKIGFINTPIEGAKLEVDSEAVKTLRVDAGGGGDYPTANCDF
ncbi:MAG: hypothetical protein V4655_13425 [Bdellovibrionota bacterium]